MIAAINNIANKCGKECEEHAIRVGETIKKMSALVEEENIFNERVIVLMQQLHSARERLARISYETEILFKETEQLSDVGRMKKKELDKYVELVRTLQSGIDINELFDNATEEGKKELEGMLKDTDLKFDR